MTISILISSPKVQVQVASKPKPRMCTRTPGPDPVRQKIVSPWKRQADEMAAGTTGDRNLNQRLKNFSYFFRVPGSPVPYCDDAVAHDRTDGDPGHIRVFARAVSDD